jgi:hypothetical protein
MKLLKRFLKAFSLLKRLRSLNIVHTTRKCNNNFRRNEEIFPGGFRLFGGLAGLKRRAIGNYAQKQQDESVQVGRILFLRKIFR